jgi:hypothetical protein
LELFHRRLHHLLDKFKNALYPSVKTAEGFFLKQQKSWKKTL